ncbi:barstar family protein [Actinomadura sp. ATCC 31491]|uniref:Barstar family protein n=1 Tax=Actinomadura luzonensis TaxID=2805427 RepID=A0ABT0FUT9_9ACTN|nr:barstar family protein [Actinomadura luzonensis]MCK2215745.1 barstar family protein [Actinomadura luzonensis]
MTPAAARPLPPWLAVSAGPAPAVLDGRACRTRAAFFEEAARALRLPGWFGRNWDALTDCLRGTGPLALVVTDAGDLLADEPPGQLAVLLDVLADAARDGLTVTLLTAPGGEAALRGRVAAALR